MSPMEVSPLPGSCRASPYPPLASSAEADWLAHDLYDLRVLLLTITVQAFVRCRTTMPSADFCCEVKAPCDAFSRESATHSRSPEVSSTAFRTQPPNLQPSALDGYGLRCHWPARPAPVCLRSGSCTSARTFAPRFFQTPPRDDALALRYLFTSIRL